MFQNNKDLKETGYYILNLKSTSALLNLAEKMGRIQPSRKNSFNKVDILTVNLNRTDKSLSSKYKDEQFPFHTDGAYLFKPPRYVILRSESDIHTCPTTLCLLNLNKEDISVLRRDVWFVNGGRGKFYSSIYSEVESDILLRFDEDCMRPAFVDNKARLLTYDLIKRSDKIEVHWKKSMTLVIDNWRILHARSDASNSHDRVLQRVWAT